MSFSRSDVSAKKHMARVSDLYGERFRSIKTVLFFIVSVSLLSGEAVPTYCLDFKRNINVNNRQISMAGKIGRKCASWKE